MGDDSWDDNEPVTAPASSGYGGMGRGGGGANKGCFKCGEEGHMSRECPQGGGGGGGGSRACHKCGEEGHFSRECPQGGGGGGGGSRACHKCGEEGHFSRECPQGGGGGGGGSRACHKCGEEGHFSRECPQGGGGGGGGNACNKCGEDGHYARDCPQGGGGGPRTCRKCGEEGHMVRECPNNEGGEDGFPIKRGCFNCGAEGHMSKECTEPRKARDGTEGGPPTENYAGAEMLEGDAIFEERCKIYEGTGINFTKYESIPFEITGDGKVKSAESFKDLTHSELVLKNVERCGYKNPTPIQKHGSPQLLNGLDVMCCAQTGSGKTCAYLLPIITNLLKTQSELTPAYTAPATPEAMILAPTRELAIQIGKEANMYAAGSVIKTQVAYGGMSTGALKNRIQNQGCNILVGTTGRIKQFVREGILDLSKVRFFILDEADRMLDMGFMADVDELVPKLPDKENRVSGMFSATFPQEIQVAAKKYLKNYIYIVIGVVGGACTDVRQEIISVERSDKRKKILEIIQGEPADTKILVFCASKKGADFLASHLSTQNVSCTSIHGDRLQSQREMALYEFTTGKRQVLVATAVAARGLDIPKVALVINYDLPTEIDEYVHRIGRTGRVGHVGRAISFYDEGQDSQIASKLVSILAGAGQEIPDFLGGADGGGFTEGGFANTDNRNGGAAAAADDDDEW